MVATVLRLRYRVLANTLARRPWQLVGFVLGMLWTAGAVFLVVVAMIGLALFQGAAEARLAAVAGGSLLVLGWVLGPVLIAGTDTTVDAARLAPFPFSDRQRMAALAGVGLTGVPGIATTLAALSTVVLWVRWPVAAIAAVPCAVIGVLTCVVASRLVATLSEGLGAGRRGRELVGTVLLILVILAGPIVTGALALLGPDGPPLARLGIVADVLGWTPLGAAWAVPADLAVAAWLPALAKAAIAAATLAVLWAVWAAVFAAAASSAPRRAARTVRSGALGLFARMPSGGVGATWARSLTAWLRDPRYLRQLLLVPLLPVLFAFTGGIDAGLFQTSPVVVALVLAISGYTDISYDGTAFATVLASGVRGREDRLGRMLAAACVAVPLIVAVTLAVTAIAGAWERLPAVLGASLGITLAGLAVSAVSSALLVTPVAAPGDSPFKSVPGQTFVSGLLVFVVLGAVLVLAAPAGVLALVGVFAALPHLAWASLAAAGVVGAVAMTVGVGVGGRILDRTGPELLARIKAFPTR